MGQREHERRRFRTATIALVTVATVVAGCSGGTSPAAPASSSTSTVSPQPTPAPQSEPAVPAPAPPPADLAAEFQQFAATLPADVGMVVGAVGGTPVSLGGVWTHGPAWSTIKVPLSIAGLRESPQAGPTDAMRGAITASDNAAADVVWKSLGSPEEAAKKVEAVLSDASAPATVPAQRPRPEFSAFGQTDWSLADQVKFLSWAWCDSANAPIFTLMSQVEGDQKWGLGAMEKAQIKGGWGPSTDGTYLVRQIAVIDTPAGKTAVAMAAVPASGSFGDGTQVLNKMATWLGEHLTALPGGQCSAPSSTPPG